MGKIKSFLSILGIVALSITFSSCNKDLNINADWRDVTVVFGLFDQQDSIHYVKINKAFLGEESAFTMAAIQDSSEYENLSAVVEQWKNGSKVKSYTLLETTVTNKEPGTFYYPDQKVYYFQENDLDEQSSYKLVATIDDDKTVEAETEIIDGMTVVTQNWKIINVAFASNNLITDPSFDIVAGADAKRFEVYINFNYTEITKWGSGNNDTTHTYKTLQLKAGEFATKTTDGGESINVVLSGEDFFKQIGENIPTIDNSDGNVQKRVVEDFEIFVAAGGQDLHTFMEVNEPTTGIVQEKDEYTNVVNGIGILSCRTSKLEAFKLSNATIDELMDGLITSNLSEDGDGYTVGRGFCNNYLPVTDPRSCWFQ